MFFFPNDLHYHRRGIDIMQITNIDNIYTKSKSGQSGRVTGMQSGK